METRLVICKVCGKEEIAYMQGKFDERNKRWVDKDGKLFNGRTCASCHRDKVRTQTNEKRHKAKQSV